MERLTDDRFLKDGFYQPKNKNEEKEIRSMCNDLTFEKLYKHCAEVEKQNAELQKQVDKLKDERRKELLKANMFEGGFKAGRGSCTEETARLREQIENMKVENQQAVKDTAMTCYEKMLEWYPVIADEEHAYSAFVERYENWLKEQLGVEVE